MGILVVSAVQGRGRKSLDVPYATIAYGSDGFPRGRRNTEIFERLHPRRDNIHSNAR